MSAEASSKLENHLALTIAKTASKYNFKIKNQRGEVVPAPVALLPTPFPMALYHRAILLQHHWLSLLHEVSTCPEFIDDMMTRLDHSDAFCDRLWRIQEKVTKVNKECKLSLLLSRSDYMLHQPDPQSNALHLKQVEINTIASSFGALSSSLSNIYLNETSTSVEPSNALQLVVNGLAKAMEYFEAAYDLPKSIAVMIVQVNEGNVFDQLEIVNSLKLEHNKAIVRLTFAEFHQHASYSDSRIYIGNQMVSVVYYRAGYSPADYPSDLEWWIRESIELSEVVTCPSVAFQLVGMKKAQQLLSDPSLLTLYMDDPNAVSQLRESFMNLYSLEDLNDPVTRRMLDQFKADPTLFVLKPQREGGGNNMTGLTALEFLENSSPETLKAFILMEKIKCPQASNVFLRDLHLSQATTISELGVFGALLQEGDQVIHSDVAGYLLRTKDCAVTEGGVAAGYGHLGLMTLT